MFAGVLALGGCLSTTAPTPSNPATETFAPALGVNIADMTKTPSGTYFQDLIAGSGSKLNVLATDSIRVDYELYLTDGEKVAVDTSATMSLNGLIFGFVDGIHGMNVGGQRLLVIPSNLAYGPNTVTGADGFALIPPNSTLVYRVTLRNIYLNPSAAAANRR
jgi:FKBP-type peptidyl-prolyl cis-trans isomerase